MVKIRLLRTGAKNQLKYRVVVTDGQRKRDGGFLEVVGNYNPIMDPPSIVIKKDRYNHWLSVGAQPTKAVSDLYKRYERINRVPS